MTCILMYCLLFCTHVGISPSALCISPDESFNCEYSPDLLWYADHLRRKYRAQRNVQSDYGKQEYLPKIIVPIPNAMAKTDETLGSPISLAKLVGKLSSDCLILLEGGPKMGKTTVCYQLCKQWESEDFYGLSVRLVIFLPLGHPNMKEPKSFQELLEHFSTKRAQNISEDLETSYGESTLFVIDNIHLLLQSHNDFLLALLNGDKFPSAMLLATSELLSVNNASKLTTKNVLRFRLNGCHSPGFGGENKRKCEIQCNVNILCPVIFQLLMQIEAYVHGDQINHMYVESQLYELYISSRITDKPTLLQIGEKAFFSVKQKKSFVSLCHVPSEWCELLYKTDSNQSVNDYNFKNDQTRMFLSAYYISKQSREFQLATFAKYCFEEHFWVVWKFFAGLTRMKTIEWVDVFNSLTCTSSIPETENSSEIEDGSEMDDSHRVFSKQYHADDKSVEDNENNSEMDDDDQVCSEQCLLNDECVEDSENDSEMEDDDWLTSKQSLLDDKCVEDSADKIDNSTCTYESEEQSDTTCQICSVCDFSASTNFKVEYKHLLKEDLSKGVLSLDHHSMTLFILMIFESQANVDLALQRQKRVFFSPSQSLTPLEYYALGWCIARSHSSWYINFIAAEITCEELRCFIRGLNHKQPSLGPCSGRIAGLSLCFNVLLCQAISLLGSMPPSILNSIVVLDLFDTSLNIESCESFAKLILHNKLQQLQVLTLSYNDVGNENGLIHILLALCGDRCPSLDVLNLCHVAMNSIEAVLLASVINYHKLLHSVSIPHSFLDSEVLNDLFVNMCESQLKHLDISSSELDEGCIHSLSNILSETPLEQLVATNCGITGEKQILALSTALGGASSLKELDIRDNYAKDNENIDSSLKRLATAICCSDTITDVRVDYELRKILHSVCTDDWLCNKLH